MKKTIAMLLAMLMLVTCFVGCAPTDTGSGNSDTTAVGGNTTAADSDLAYIQGKGKIVVGITDYAPMDYKDENGNWIGFDAEFAQMFAKKLGVEVEFFVIADWSKKFFELDSKNIDVIWNGMTITDEVTLNTSCSNPYVVNAQVIVMKADKLAQYPDIDSMKDLNVAVENGSAGQTAAEEAGFKNIIAVQDQAAALMEVKAGTSDACVIDITMAYAMTGEGTNYADLGVGVSLTSEQYGVGFRKNSDVTAMFNDFMAEVMADGTLDALAEKYGVTLVK